MYSLLALDILLLTCFLEALFHFGHDLLLPFHEWLLYVLFLFVYHQFLVDFIQLLVHIFNGLSFRDFWVEVFLFRILIGLPVLGFSISVDHVLVISLWIKQFGDLLLGVFCCFLLVLVWLDSLARTHAKTLIFLSLLLLFDLKACNDVFTNIYSNE